MLARLAAFFVWALVAACVVYWSLKLLVRAPGAPAHSVAVTGAAPERGDLTRLLGVSAVAPVSAMATTPQASRFRLHGVIAPKGKPAAKPTGQGVALISVDGKPPRAYAVGARVDNDLVLQSVSLRGASIGLAGGAASVNLEASPLPVAATGKLSGLGAPVPLVAPAAPGAAQFGAGVQVAQPPAAGTGIPAPAIRQPTGIPTRRDLANSR
jgi:general secretion pathway protein C